MNTFITLEADIIDITTEDNKTIIEDDKTIIEDNTVITRKL